MWQMMLAGVFDRHPSLRLVFTEVRADWVPATLAHLDGIVDRDRVPMQRKPSEYWASNCYTTASSMRRSEVELRHEIGIDRIMFGRDYPHPEGTWPNTLDWIRATFGGVSEQETRAILGGNAIECYGLDRAALTAVAAGIGPRIEDLLGQHEIAPAKIDHFNMRSGYSMPAATFDAAAVQPLLDEDLAGCQVR